MWKNEIKYYLFFLGIFPFLVLFATAFRRAGFAHKEHQLGVLNAGLKETHTVKENNNSADHAFSKALELNPGNDVAYAGLGNIYQSQGRLQQAEECFKKALELNPGNDVAYAGLGNIYQSQGRLQQAEEYFKKALELIEFQE